MNNLKSREICDEFKNLYCPKLITYSCKGPCKTLRDFNRWAHWEIGNGYTTWYVFFIFLFKFYSFMINPSVRAKYIRA